MIIDLGKTVPGKNGRHKMHLHKRSLRHLREREWNSTFFKLSVIIEGTSERAFQFIMSLLMSNGNKFNEQKCIFW